MLHWHDCFNYSLPKQSAAAKSVLWALHSFPFTQRTTCPMPILFSFCLFPSSLRLWIRQDDLIQNTNFTIKKSPTPLLCMSWIFHHQISQGHFLNGKASFLFSDYDLSSSLCMFWAFWLVFCVIVFDLTLNYLSLLRIGPLALIILCIIVCDSVLSCTDSWIFFLVGLCSCCLSSQALTLMCVHNLLNLLHFGQYPCCDVVITRQKPLKLLKSATVVPLMRYSATEACRELFHLLY